jgi:GMP synthase (glutamine-hydrolysing)
MAGRSSGFSAPCIHRDEVTALPSGMVVLAGNAHSQVQMAVYEGQGVQFWGSQYHPELGLADIADYLRLRDGVFARHSALLAQIETVAHSPSTAATLGGCPADLELHQRARELRNWLVHIGMAETLSSAARIG